MWISICAAQLLVRTASTFLFTALCTTPHFDVKPTCHLKHTRGFQHHQLAANCPFGAVQVRGKNMAAVAENEAARCRRKAKTIVPLPSG